MRRYSITLEGDIDSALDMLEQTALEEKSKGVNSYSERMKWHEIWIYTRKVRSLLEEVDSE